MRRTICAMKKLPIIATALVSTISVGIAEPANKPVYWISAISIGIAETANKPVYWNSSYAGLNAGHAWNRDSGGTGGIDPAGAAGTVTIEHSKLNDTKQNLSYLAYYAYSEVPPETKPAVTV